MRLNNFQMDYLLNEVEKSKGSLAEVTKDEVLSFLQDNGLEYSPKTAKATLIDYIRGNDLSEKFCNQFCERFMVPIWQVAKCFNLYQFELEALIDYGVFKEKGTMQSYKGRNGKFEALAFPLTCLNQYEASYLKEQYELATSVGTYRMRVETNTLDELEPILEQMRQQFEVIGCDSYKHSNGQGYYHYIRCRTIPTAPVVERAYLSKIEKLQIELKSAQQEIDALKRNNRPFKEALKICSMQLKLQEVLPPKLYSLIKDKMWE